jgi:hypothetical protein
MVAILEISNLKCTTTYPKDHSSEYSLQSDQTNIFLTFMFTMVTTAILKMWNPKCTSHGLKIALAWRPGLPFLAAGLSNFVRRKARRTSTYKIYPPINFTYIDEMLTFLHRSKFPMINIATIKTITNQNCFLLWSDVFIFGTILCLGKGITVYSSIVLCPVRFFRYFDLL